MSHKCKDCNGKGWATTGPASGPIPDCPTCEGKGGIHRTGPYRLADGTWSDGVDRSRRIAERGDTVLGRWEVTLLGMNVNRPWRAFILHSEVHWESRYYPTHTEAIAWVDRMARSNP